MCALDPLPAAQLSEHNFAIFELLATLIAYELEEQDSDAARVAQLLEAVQLAEEREKMMGILGHDLRTPLTAIKLSAEAIVIGHDPGDVQPLAMQIISSATRMNRMITDLLDFTRSRFSGGLPLSRRQTIDMRAVCEKVVQELQIANPRRTIHFTAEGDTRGGWDGDRIAQVVSNLVSNALDYSLPGTTIEVDLSGDDDVARLAVINTASELPPDVMESMFRAFHGGQASNTRSRGVGLGLFIVEQILHAHGGEVSVESSGGQVRFDTVWPRRGVQQRNAPQ